MGALALTSKAAYREPFEPLPGDVTFVPYGDADALAAAVDRRRPPRSCSSRSRARPASSCRPPGYLAAAREIAREHGALLWLDEVQTGHRPHRCVVRPPAADGVAPDVVTLAKGLGGGFPIGACIGLGDAGRRCSSPATTAPPSAATRSPARPRSPSSTPSRTTACSST